MDFSLVGGVFCAYNESIQHTFLNGMNYYNLIDNYNCIKLYPSILENDLNFVDTYIKYNPDYLIGANDYIIFETNRKRITYSEFKSQNNVIQNTNRFYLSSDFDFFNNTDFIRNEENVSVLHYDAKGRSLFVQYNLYNKINKKICHNFNLRYEVLNGTSTSELKYLWQNQFFQFEHTLNMTLTTKCNVEQKVYTKRITDSKEFIKINNKIYQTEENKNFLSRTGIQEQVTILLAQNMDLIMISGIEFINSNIKTETGLNIFGSIIYNYSL